jgi:hypothetical protein
MAETAAPTAAAIRAPRRTGWTWPGNHAATLVTGAYPTVWKSATARKPRLLVFQGDADGAVTPENLADVTQQWKGAVGITGAGTTTSLKGHVGPVLLGEVLRARSISDSFGAEATDVKFLCSLIVLLTLFVGAMPSCAEPVEPTLDLTPMTQTLITGQPLQLTVTRRFPGGSIEDVTSNVTYTSNNRVVASVSERGVLTPGTETGTVIIKVFDPSSNATALASFLVVEAAITSIDISPSVLVMTRATPPRAFIATARFNNGTTREVTEQVLWTSTNTAAAIVGNSQIDRGVVSAVADGDTTIQATDAKTGVAGRATVFVTGGSAVLQAIVLTPNPAKVAVGMIQEMTALGVYSDGTTKNLTKTVSWSSSRTDVAVIDSGGVVTGVALGDTTISALAPEPSPTVRGSAAVKVGP